MPEYELGSVDDFPVGTHQVVMAGKAAIGVFNVDGQFYALPNVCPHQAGPVCTGPVVGTMVCNAGTEWRHEWRREGQIITCPWHGLEFDITTGACLAGDRYRLRTYTVHIANGRVIVSI